MPIINLHVSHNLAFYTVKIMHNFKVFLQMGTAAILSSNSSWNWIFKTLIDFGHYPVWQRDTNHDKYLHEKSMYSRRWHKISVEISITIHAQKVPLELPVTSHHLCFVIFLAYSMWGLVHIGNFLKQAIFMGLKWVYLDN